MKPALALYGSRCYNHAVRTISREREDVEGYGE